MTRVRRGRYVFITWVGDHSPRHVHVLRDGRLVLKWDLEGRRAMVGSAGAKVMAIIRQLEEEGLL